MLNVPLGNWIIMRNIICRILTLSQSLYVAKSTTVFITASFSVGKIEPTLRDKRMAGSRSGYYGSSCHRAPSQDATSAVGISGLAAMSDGAAERLMNLQHHTCTSLFEFLSDPAVGGKTSGDDKSISMVVAPTTTGFCCDGGDILIYIVKHL